ncbi:MAG: endolytic transglycosylase MltG [Anaerolineae bacterium]|nr:endolytic transglycosylase MltG [Anaerolineae bacterium]
MRNVLRVLFFVTAVAALVVMSLAGFAYVSEQLAGSGPGGPAQEGTGASTVTVSVGSPEDMLIGLYLQLRQADLARPASDEDVQVPFRVEPGETAGMVAMRLEEAGLVRDAGLLSLYMRHQGLDARLEAGEYLLSPRMTIPEIAEALQHGRIQEVTVTIVEGLRMEQVAEVLAQAGVTDAEGFQAVVRGEVRPEIWAQYRVLQDRPPGAGLEGYLFPDTYRFPRNADPVDVVRRMVERFTEQFTPEMEGQAQQRGLSVFSVVTLASIVEREAVVPEERPLIADVFLNRLAQGMYLQADPTVQYALGYQPDTGEWWLRPLPVEASARPHLQPEPGLHPGSAQPGRHRLPLLPLPG